jgi:hypothetical protein
MSKQEEEETVFEFWNSFKGSKTSIKRDPKTGDLIQWHSHNKLTHDMRVAIRENLKDYTLEEICTAIHNYAEALLGDKYFWTYVWPLSIFLSVKYEKRKDGNKKWWKFLPENFDRKVYLKRGNIEEQENIIEDPDPDLTNMLIATFRKERLCREGFVPNLKQIGQFRLASQKMIKFYKNRSCQDKKIWLEDLFECLEQNYLSKGEAISIGLLCSDHLWDFLMPQLLRQCGRE